MVKGITIYPFNLLGESGVTVTAFADAAYPKARLYDRSLNFYWQYTNTAAFTITADAGASFSKYIDFLAVVNHNWSGATIDWQYSDNGTAWTNALPQWTQSGSLPIYKELTTPLLHRYWRASIGSVASPRATEVYMSLGYPFRVVWSDTPTGRDQDNVDWIKTVGSLERSVKIAEAQKMRTYPIFHHKTDVSTLSSFRTAMDYLDEYSKPFFVKDHENGYWFARLVEVSEEEYNSEGIAHRNLSLMEML
jgi:hypothetical protein